MKICVVGDLEGNISRLYDLQAKLKGQGILFYIQVGDFGLFRDYEALKANKKYYNNNKKRKQLKSYLARYKLNRLRPFSDAVAFIKGNNEDFDFLEDMDNNAERFRTLYKLMYLPTLLAKINNELSFGVIGGIYSSVKSHEFPETLKDRDRRFFTQDEVQSILQSKGTDSEPEFVISHQAPTGVLPKQEEGSDLLRPLLDDLNLKYYIHGHHHYNYETTIGTTKVIGLGNMDKNPNSYKVLEF